MPLDPLTLAYYTTGTSMLLAVLALGYGRSRRVHPGFGWWTLSLVLVSLALASVALRESVGGVVFAYGPTVFGACGMLVIVQGQARFFEERAPLRLLIGMTVAAVVAMAIADLADRTPWRLASGAATTGALALYAGGRFLRQRAPALRGAAVFCGAVLIGFGLVRLWRAGYLLGTGPGFDVLQNTTASVVNYLSNALFSTLWCFGFVFLNASRIEAELDASREELRQLAATDPLTGLRNRRAFFVEAENELRRARRYRMPVALLMIDIDRFKQVNDRFGHLAGDKLLTEVGAALARELRTTDIHARFGGEEFVALLVQTPAADVLPTAERLRRAVASLSIESLGALFSTTVSIGTAAVADGDVELEELVRYADAALYKAKQGGRDRVVSA